MIIPSTLQMKAILADCNLDEPWRYSCKLKQAPPKRTNTLWIRSYEHISYEILKHVKFIETESRVVMTRGHRERGVGSYLVGMAFQFCKMRKILEMVVLYHHVSVFNARELHTLNWLKLLSFVWHTKPQFKKWVWEKVKMLHKTKS